MEKDPRDRLIAWQPHSVNPIMAGVRYRCLNPLRHLRARRYPVELFEPAHAERYSAVVIQALCCRADPARPHTTGDALIETVRGLQRRGVSILVDECDNHFHNPKGDPSWAATAARIGELFGLADHLVASTDAIAEVMRANADAAKPVTVIGDGAETSQDVHHEPRLRRWLSWQRKLAWLRQQRLLRAIRAEKAAGVTQLVWFGNHGTSYAHGGMLDLLKVRALVESLHARQALSLTVISNSEQKYRETIEPWKVPTRYVDWDRVTFLGTLREHHIALIPIEVDAFTRCKSNNRVALALHEGLAVVADAIPSYEVFRGAAALDDWERGLAAYVGSPTLRAEHVRAGQAEIQRHWTTERIASRWAQLFDSLPARRAAAPAGAP
jgi:hypothetical protein